MILIKPFDEFMLIKTRIANRIAESQIEPKWI